MVPETDFSTQPTVLVSHLGVTALRGTNDWPKRSGGRKRWGLHKRSLQPNKGSNKDSPGKEQNLTTHPVQPVTYYRCVLAVDHDEGRY